ncbi:hypothetical protein V1527DRAFT_515621 [Lipomyces starkeyi]
MDVIAILTIHRQRVSGEPFVRSLRYIQPLSLHKKAKSTVSRVVFNSEDNGGCSQVRPPRRRTILMSVMRRQLSPDVTIEVPPSWDEYQRAQELLDLQGNKSPLLRYDGKRQFFIAIVVAAPTPLHGDIGYGSKWNRGIHKISTRSHGRMVREWDGAIHYLYDGDLRNMIAIEVAVSQSIKSLQEVISWTWWYKASLRGRLQEVDVIEEIPRDLSAIKPQTFMEDMSDAILITTLNRLEDTFEVEEY